MYKNIVIIFLVFVLCSLMFQNKQNIKIIASNLAETKKLVSETKDYVAKTFEDEFSVEEFVVGIEIPSLHPEDEEEVK